MRQLLSRHPSLNETDKDGMTPLHIEIDSRQTECVGLLLKAGADLNARDRRGRTAFDAALQGADRANGKAILGLVWNLRLDRAPASAPVGGWPWSLESAMHRQSDITKMLLAMGADPNATGPNLGRVSPTPVPDSINVKHLRL